MEIFAVDHHAGIVAGLLRSAPHGDETGEAPVDHVLREMELQPVPFVIGKIVAVRGQHVRAGHRVGGLTAEKPVEAGFFVMKDMEAHLASGTWQEQRLMAGGHGFELGGHGSIVVFHDLCHRRIAGASGVGAGPQVKGPAFRVVPDVAGIGELHDVGFEPTDGRTASAGRGHEGFRVVRRVEGNSEIIEDGCAVVVVGNGFLE